MRIGVIMQIGEEAEFEYAYFRKSLENARRVGEVFAYLDAPSDGGATERIVREFIKPENVIVGVEKMFAKELLIKQMLLERAVASDCDWVFWQDADEICDRNFHEGETNNVRALIKTFEEHKVDSAAFPLIQLWRSNCWHRVDSAFDKCTVPRLFKNTGRLKYVYQAGLHKPQIPDNLKKTVEVRGVNMIHFGFASKESILRKYVRYQSYGARSVALARLINEDSLTLQHYSLNNYPDFARPAQEDAKPVNAQLWTEASNKWLKHNQTKSA